MVRYYDNRETLPRDERLKRQRDELRLMTRDGYRVSPFFRRTLDELSIEPPQFQSIEELEKLPVITREKLIDLQRTDPPYGGFADPTGKIDRIFISPGPVYEPHLSENDLLWARAYTAAGITSGDVVLNAFSYHMVAAGLTFHGGLRRTGATVVPSGTSSTQIQVQLIRDLKITAYTGTPSFLMAIIRKAEEEGYNFCKSFSVRKACFCAEPLEESLRKKFEDEYGIETYQMYGATEVGDIGYECPMKRGLHICEEVLVEIVDPATGRNVPRGALGEVVVTRFNRLFFLFRFGTGDLSRLLDAPCACGRTSPRLDGIAGRIGDAVKVRGLFITPTQLRMLSRAYENKKFQVVVTRREHEDCVTVSLEMDESEAPDQQFCDAFREICTVRIDRLQRVPRGTLNENDPLVLDQRIWQ
jgi:phenylacetate-CoA ligase